MDVCFKWRQFKSSAYDVDVAVQAASKALPSWKGLTMKSRAAMMLKFHGLVESHKHELAQLIVMENGKNYTEALADVAKGNETVEYACSLPQMAQGKILEVSRGVMCQDKRVPLGVVACIVPFNFPFMVPMWTVPIALVMGNCVVLKPSEKVPLTMYRVAELMIEAGFPKGVFNMVNGSVEAVNALIDHKEVRAVTFVGSSPVAKIVSSRCQALNKRCTALGGAKNHLIALPDCEVESAARDIVVSFAGCSGQRCMAASVLLLVGGEKQDKLLDIVMKKAAALKAGTDTGCMGPVIDKNSSRKILSYIADSEKEGATILLDGRKWMESHEGKGGEWIGPTIIKHSSRFDKAVKDEIFGPVLSVVSVQSWEEAIDIENSNPFGNAACIYTSNGGHAGWFTSRFRASMLGVNIGIPVPREPFSFGGLYGTYSKYGDQDITGDGAIEFFSNRIKISTRWPSPQTDEFQANKVVDTSMNGCNGHTVTDHANFNGRI